MLKLIFFLVGKRFLSLVILSLRVFHQCSNKYIKYSTIRKHYIQEKRQLISLTEDEVYVINVLFPNDFMHAL